VRTAVAGVNRRDREKGYRLDDDEALQVELGGKLDELGRRSAMARVWRRKEGGE